jgi:hypothetical protein
MVTLSWNEIRARAVRFANEWKDEISEHAEAKTFWDQFFQVFGVSRRRVAHFEERVKTIDGKSGYIDLLWKSVLLVEHKSRGQNLDRAYIQARDYFPGIRDSDLPQYILVSDFEHFRLYDLDNNGERSFTLEQLPQNLELFAFMAGYQRQDIREQNPVNIEAAEKMGKLHDKLKQIGYKGMELELFLVRLLFCLFADDTGIFDKDYFCNYLQQQTHEDGRNLGTQICQIFQVLNTPLSERFSNMNESLNGFPYVNGKLFEDQLRIASFDREMRQMILECSTMDWGKISPAVFGSLFQSVMDKNERRSLGAHYTSEENIMKVINPLFLDDLWKEFYSLKGSKKKLESFHDHIAKLKFLDPACGCGNFLIIVYREMRLLEMEIIRELLKEKTLLEIGVWLKVDVDQFYGIEIGEFSSQIAQVALWLIDHQMNMKISQEFGQYYVRIPLRNKPNIIHGNALLLEWESVIKKTELNFILGNPPFIGTAYMSKNQKKELIPVLSKLKKSGQLDYVSGWFIKASEYIGGTRIKVGFVSTNSIVQGVQAVLLWKYILKHCGQEIFFAHQTFQWLSEARGKAAVFCVIIGFGHIQEKANKIIFTYQDIKGKPTLKHPKNINQYLLDAPCVFVEPRSTPIHKQNPMLVGTSPLDYGHYIFSKNEMVNFVTKEPLSKKYFRKYIGGKELINGNERYILYLKNCPPLEIRKMKYVIELVNSVRVKRLESDRKATKELAMYPTKLAEDRVLDSDLLILPKVSSGNRNIIPIGYYKYPTVCSDKTFQIANASLYLFGILNSIMHMAWMKVIGGRLKGDFSYSNTLVYNNFIFPEPTEKQQKEIEKQASLILSVRKEYLESGHTLADLYDPITMPPDLQKAHENLDRLVDKAYRYKKEMSYRADNVRVEFLFEKYIKKIQGEEQY